MRVDRTRAAAISRCTSRRRGAHIELACGLLAREARPPSQPGCSSNPSHVPSSLRELQAAGDHPSMAVTAWTRPRFSSATSPSRGSTSRSRTRGVGVDPSCSSAGKRASARPRWRAASARSWTGRHTCCRAAATRASPPRPLGPFVEIAHEAGARVATALPSTREATADRGWSPAHHSSGDLRVLRHGKRWCTAELVATCE